jgi:hypothetical protein
MNSDPTSLQNLNDIILPAAVSWWPLAPGWYVLAALLLVVLLVWLYRSIRRYRFNRYRRQALIELNQLKQLQPVAAVKGLPELLKRTALAVFPRQQVASLSGKEWSDFLDGTYKGSAFSQGGGLLLEKISCTDAVVAEADSIGLFDDAEDWIRHHHVEERH